MKAKELKSGDVVASDEYGTIGNSTVEYNCSTGHLVAFTSGPLAPYRTWEVLNRKIKAKAVTKVTRGGRVVWRNE